MPRISYRFTPLGKKSPFKTALKGPSGGDNLSRKSMKNESFCGEESSRGDLPLGGNKNWFYCSGHRSFPLRMLWTKIDVFCPLPFVFVVVFGCFINFFSRADCPSGRLSRCNSGLAGAAGLVAYRFESADIINLCLIYQSDSGYSSALGALKASLTSLVTSWDDQVG